MTHEFAGAYSAVAIVHDRVGGTAADSWSTARRIRALRPILVADSLHGKVVKKDRNPKVLKERHGLENFVRTGRAFVLATPLHDRA
jgi:hypothetical protein